MEVNTELLENAIANSGYKLGYIANTVGISRQALNMKMHNKRKFKIAEIYVISHLLDLSNEEKMNIFYAEKVN